MESRNRNGEGMSQITDIPYKRWHDAVFCRSSRRRFDGSPLDEKDLIELKDLVQKGAEIFPGARIIILQEGFQQASQTFIGSYGLVSGAQSYAAILARTAHGMDPKLQAGFLGEMLILEATARGIDTCWMGGFFKAEHVQARVGINPGEEVLAITPLGRAVDSLTLTERLVKQVAQSRKRRPLSELCTGRKLAESPKWMQTAVEAARLAPSALNRQPWQFEIGRERVKLLATEIKKDHGVPTALDLGIALLHLVVGAGSKACSQAEFSYEDPPAVASVSIS